MIDKQQFNNTFQHFEKDTMIMIIDLFIDQYPRLIKDLEQNISDHDLVQVMLNAHKLNGSLLQFYDPVSSEHARRMEEAAKMKLQNLEKSIGGDEIPQIFSELKIASEELLMELLEMKKELA